MEAKRQRKSTTGRPPKFDEASTPVTVTLPLRTLEALRSIDRDRARAIVKCVDAASGGPPAPVGIEIINAFGPFSLIVVPPCPSLGKLAGLRLVEIAPDRFLLVTVGDYSTQDLELDLHDLMEKQPPEDEAERALLDELRHMLARHRRQESITGGKILLIDAGG